MRFHGINSQFFSVVGLINSQIFSVVGLIRSVHHALLLLEKGESFLTDVDPGYGGDHTIVVQSGWKIDVQMDGQGLEGVDSTISVEKEGPIFQPVSSGPQITRCCFASALIPVSGRWVKPLYTFVCTSQPQRYILHGAILPHVSKRFVPTCEIRSKRRSTTMVCI